MIPAGTQGETDLETILLGPVLPERDCGDCTMCCTLLTVNTPDFAKPAGNVLCPPDDRRVRHSCDTTAHLPDMVLRVAQGRKHARRSPP